MCSKKMIVCNKEGYVLKHSSCGRMEIGFGTTAYTLTKKEYAQFSEQIEQALTDYWSHAQKPKTKSIYLYLFSEHVAIVLSYNELSRLNELIEEANFQLQLTDLLGYQNEDYGNNLELN